MHIDTDSSDTLTLRHELKLKKSLTSVSKPNDRWRYVSNVSVVCQCVEIKLSEREVSVKNFLVEGMVHASPMPALRKNRSG